MLFLGPKAKYFSIPCTFYHNDAIIQLLFMSRDPDDVINPARFYK